MSIVLIIAVIVGLLIFFGMLFNQWRLAREVKTQKDFLHAQQQNLEVRGEKIANLQQTIQSLKLEHGKTEKSLKQVLNNWKAEFSGQNVQELSETMRSEASQRVQQLVKKTLDRRFSRMSQELVGSLSDRAEEFVRSMKIDLNDKIWDAFQQYKGKLDDSPIIIPDGTKLMYTKGIRTVMVLEQKPQTRTLTFEGNLLSDQVRNQCCRQVNHNYYYNMALPYVYFIFVFDNNVYHAHEMFFRSKPLTSAREYISSAPLPNLHNSDDGKWQPVCMGRDYRVPSNASLSQQCDQVISDFWQRSFNADLGHGTYSKIDPRLKDFAVWQANTAKNPLFILEVVWPKGRTVKGVLEYVLERRPNKSTLDTMDQTIMGLLDRGVSSLNKQISAITAKAGEHGKNIRFKNEDKEFMEEVLTSHARRVFDAYSKKIA